MGRFISINHKKIRIISRVLVLMVSILSIGIVCYAASATISLSSKNTSVTVGDTVSVSLTVRSSANIGDFETYISYNSDVLEFKEGGAFVNGGDGILKVSDINNVDGTTKKKYVLTFKALDTGATEIKLSDKAVVFDYDQGDEMSVSSSPLSIRVNAKKETSNNNNLKTLKINPGTLSPTFNKETTNYKVDVDSKTESLIISATPEDSKGKVFVKNAENLVEGENKVIVTVKAESGVTKEYTIIVTKEKSIVSNENDSENIIDPDNTEDNIEDTDETEDTQIHVENVDGKIKISAYNTYEIIPLPEEVSIPDGFTETKIKIDDISITAYTIEEDLESEFLLIYAKNYDGVSGFYLYDKVEKTMQRYITPSANSSESQNTSVYDNEKNKEKLNQMYIIMAGLIGLNIVTILIAIKIYMNKKGYKEDELD